MIFINEISISLLLKVISFSLALSPFLFNKLVNFNVRLAIIIALVVFLYPLNSSFQHKDHLEQIATGIILGLSAGIPLYALELLAMWFARYYSLERKFYQNSFQLFYFSCFLFFLNIYSKHFLKVFQFFLEGLNIELSSNNQLLLEKVFSLFKLALSSAVIFAVPLFICVLVYVFVIQLLKKHFPLLIDRSLVSTGLMQFVILVCTYCLLNIETVLDNFILKSL